MHRLPRLCVRVLRSYVSFWVSFAWHWDFLNSLNGSLWWWRDSELVRCVLYDYLFKTTTFYVDNTLLLFYYVFIMVSIDFSFICVTFSLHFLPFFPCFPCLTESAAASKQCEPCTFLHAFTTLHILLSFVSDMVMSVSI